MTTTETPSAGSAPHTFLTTEEVAARYRTSASTIRYWRMTNSGPAGVKYGRRVLYSIEAVEAFEARQDRGAA